MPRRDLPAGYHEYSPPGTAVLGALVHAAMLLLLMALLPRELPDHATWGLVLGVGIIGLWRWSWGGLHLLRALIYRWLVFPRIRRAAELQPPPRSLFVLVTSYRMKTATNVLVYGKLFDEIQRIGVPAFIVACITDPADAQIIGQMFRNCDALPEGTTLRIIAQTGTGKRSAMAEALEAIAAQHPLPGAQVVLMDGDTLLSSGTLSRTCSVLAAMPRVGAVTTDNIPLVAGHALIREWYRVRLTQRTCLMNSLSLSRRLLVLTGRFSVFRAEIATSPDFILAIAHDEIDHWRLGRITMVTGDDKSTWFTVLRHGWEMLYVPDVAVYNIEEPPTGKFVPDSITLMLRWYGNMARNNGRALGLGPRRCGWFIWLCLLDQRLSPWTSFVGLTTMLLGALLRDPYCLVYYPLWVLVTRTAVCGVYFTIAGRFHPMFPLILYYHQIVGAAVKIHAFHHPDRQKWTRQKVGAGPTRQGDPARLASDLMMAVQVGLFLLGMAMLAGVTETGPKPVPPAGIMDLLQGNVRPVHSVKSPNSAY
ncbi:Glycosyltransferase family 2 protein [Rhodovastum atsumiense]|uniref:Glycosyltransferase family 2 protein n=1 Tax=Rhodovastum atsumiense TaxID=504468 RepID=A0A5M6IV15_9PROT|nr:glycosyltransferase [Rhodovastum atsumiense]KAA5612144.1 glycosyltransferase family 2 protein [Rhodovastum atsumiense]CAH2603911.1 Glycosyltransferase family 2 protein [Rhodovastum atsumiense]